ncbi:hypothetical protein [Nostoc sp.]|uniref:hypothetical protein n=1 Tax=Nostoc sp. TaxID=1180 RepID=UPI002FFA8F40
MKVVTELPFYLDDTPVPSLNLIMGFISSFFVAIASSGRSTPSPENFSLDVVAENLNGCDRLFN